MSAAGAFIEPPTTQPLSKSWRGARQRGEDSLVQIHRLWLLEEAAQDVQQRLVVLLVQAAVGRAGKHGEVLLGVRQAFEELDQVVEARNAIVLAARDHRRHRDARR